MDRTIHIDLPEKDINEQFYYSVEPDISTFKNVKQLSLLNEERNEGTIQNIYEDPHPQSTGASVNSPRFISKQNCFIPLETDDMKLSQHRRTGKMSFFYLAYFFLAILVITCFMLGIIHVFFPNKLIDVMEGEINMMKESILNIQNETTELKENLDKKIPDNIQKRTSDDIKILARKLNMTSIRLNAVQGNMTSRKDFVDHLNPIENILRTICLHSIKPDAATQLIKACKDIE